MKLAEDVDLYELARITEGATGAEIKAIVTEAGYNAIRNNRRKVNMNDFLEAVHKVMSKKSIREKNIDILGSKKKESLTSYMF